MTTCFCCHEWCTEDFRSKHKFGDVFVLTSAIHQFKPGFLEQGPKINEYASFRSHLALDQRYSNSLDFISDFSKDKRIWICHFHEVDMNIDANGSLPVKCKLKQSLTGYKVNTGNDSTKAYPRPAATRIQIETSIYFSSSSKRSRISSASSLPPPVPPPERTSKPKPYPIINPILKKLRNDGNKLKHSFKQSIVSADKILQAVHMGAHHEKHCGGTIHSRSDHVVHRALALTIKITCSLGGKCTCWNKGIWKWAGCNTTIIDGKVHYNNNVKFVLADLYTPGMTAQHEQLLTHLQLHTPCRKTWTKLLHSKIKKIILDKKKAIEEERMAKLRTKSSMNAEIDTGF